MKKIYLVVLLGLVLCSLLNAGDYFIGTGTSTQNKVPTYGYNNYGWSKFFYTGDELAAAGVSGTIGITGMAFQVSNSISNYVMDNQQIYMRYFYNTSYGSTDVGYPNTTSGGFTHVYGGPVTFNGPGWLHIQFSQPFNYTYTVGQNWGIEILWENRDGSKVGGPPSFYYQSQSYNCVYKHQDASFPTVNGTRGSYHPNIWFITPATEVPPPATAIEPLNEATGVGVNTSLKWNHNGGDPTEYRLWFWKNEPLTYIESNLLLTENTYTPPSYLDYGTAYSWRVVPVNGIGPAVDCPEWTFTTMADPTIYDFPYTQGFEGSFNPTGWTDHSGGLIDPIVLGADESSQWMQDDWLNIASTDKAARMNIWGSVSGYFISPLLFIANDNYWLEFDLALLKYGQPPTGTPPAQNGDDDRFAVLVGDGFSWSTADILREWNNTSSPFVFNGISIYGTNVSIPLAGLTGRKRIAFFAGSTISNADNDIMINNLVVKEKLATPVVNVIHDQALGVINLSWAPVPNAVQYRVLSSDTPDGTYEQIGTSGVNSYQTTPTAPKAFYKIIATSER